MGTCDREDLPRSCLTPDSSGTTPTPHRPMGVRFHGQNGDVRTLEVDGVGTVITVG